ncbi:type 2 isopentenyl-diphosphate Delta-isomerase [Acetonema longum]|uniref:Isopentenyl-diphosphate delta-isomerase n=1 Tax=Acetonema longum DSM 6540 TaxID=1009370 RepID=F7NGC2_9FIRM|nr:type 2 isopentenyl-diphosphate Delta-isomerase [Acetonema longum]EGO64915.1 isopentenyl pyrophosphate isomerase [Acetonema longum DSM 6540]
MNLVTRQSRKADHLKHALQLADGPSQNGFKDIFLIHNCLPELAWEDISLEISLGDLRLAHPIIMNAITGGSTDVTAINEALAMVARLTNSAMAVGSQYAAIEDPSVADSFKIVRKVYPKGCLIANLGAYANCEDAQRAVDMIEANALQIHLNVAQEIVMSEGDRNFTGYLKNIERIVSKVGVPVIVKEVGCGVAREQAVSLALAGVRIIDVGGAGGTNFLAIETSRNEAQLEPELLEWGLPTALTAMEVLSAVGDQVDVIVSGGVRTPLDIAKALALGGRAVGLAAPVLRALQAGQVEQTALWLTKLIDDVKRVMLLVGAKRVEHLSHVPLVVTGFSREWLRARGIDFQRA